MGKENIEVETTYRAVTLTPRPGGWEKLQESWRNYVREELKKPSNLPPNWRSRVLD